MEMKLPDGWVIAPIGEIFDTSSGTTPPRAMYDRYFRNGTIPWVKTLDLNNSEIHLTDEAVTDVALSETSLRIYTEGSVLVAMYGGFNQIGRTGLLRIPGSVNQAVTAILPNRKRVVPRYLLDFLNFKVGYWKTVASSSRKDPNITSNDVRTFPLTLPPLPEQSAIASALSDVDALLSSLDALIAKKRDIKQAAMQQLLTGKTRLPGFKEEWVVTRLGDHATLIRNGVYSRAELSIDGRVKYLHYGDIHTCGAVYLNPSEAIMPFLDADKAVRLGRLVSGDLVFVDATEDLAGVGKSVEVVGAEGTELVAGLHTIAVRFDKRILADGFKAYLQFIPAFGAHLRSLAAGTKVLSTNRSHIASAEIALPSIAEQAAIAEVLSDMDAELAALKARRDKTRLLKQGMMQELLTGKTRLV
ncbi:restriction endonuclease subunit S [Burkholderia gladioli]|uniref:restriction endonuclease subunit S n=1 Tax=Burkholderia gladioli TaxID=28095 RepID=UPI00163FB8E5|nr:restriction endonuclease subunit S [Burkholderia gladioli]